MTICAKGGSLGDGYNTVTVTGPQSGTLSTPENAGGNIPELSHYSVTGITEGGTTSSSSSSSSFLLDLYVVVDHDNDRIGHDDHH